MLRNKSRRQPGIRPGQAKVAQATSFPMVGTTLSSYGKHPWDADTNLRVVKPKAKIGRRITLKRVVITLLVLILAVGGYIGGSLGYNAYKIFGNSIFSLFNNTTLKGQSSGRVNILLAGNSADDPGHDGANLTDSIMLISVDTKNNTAFLLSIPRDLWVKIPGGGHQKINAAYVVGQNDNFSAPGYPNGGMGLLEEVVSQDFGVPIDYYALIDYNAIKSAVNAVGGITINIQSSDPRGLYDPSIDYSTNKPLVDLSNGPHTLNGQQALDLARARGDAYGAYGFANSDFERTANQRQMIIALKSKATSAGVLSNPISLGQLFNSVGTNVKTDLSLPDVHELYNLTKSTSVNSIQSVSIQKYLTSYYAYDGEDALVPTAGTYDYSQIQAYMRQLLVVAAPSTK